VITELDDSEKKEVDECFHSLLNTLQTLMVSFTEVPLVPDRVFLSLDRALRHFSMDCSRSNSNLVNFNFQLKFHKQSTTTTVHIYTFHSTKSTLYVAFGRWPYPFLDLTSNLAPLW